MMSKKSSINGAAALQITKRRKNSKKSLISDVVNGGIFGLGSYGYILAIIAMHKMLLNENK